MSKYNPSLSFLYYVHVPLFVIKDLILLRMGDTSLAQICGEMLSHSSQIILFSRSPAAGGVLLLYLFVKYFKDVLLDSSEETYMTKGSLKSTVCDLFVQDCCHVVKFLS